MPFPTEAFVIESPGSPFKLEDIQLDDPARGEVLVKVVACGICQTDIHTQHGTFPSQYPCMLGHEGAGTVAALGEGVTSVKVGDKVLLSFASCQECNNCAKKAPAACLSWTEMNFGRQRPDGSYTNAAGKDGRRIHGNFFGQSALAKHALVMESSVVVVPSSTDLVQLAPLGCGMQTGSGAVLNVIKAERPEMCSIVIFGMGAVGFSAAFASIQQRFKNIVAVDLVQTRLDQALDLGVQHALNGKEIDLVEQLIALTGGGADYVIEATGAPVSIRNGWKVLAPGGRMVQLGSPGDGHNFEIPIHESICLSKTYSCNNQGGSNPREFLPQLIKMHETGDFPLETISKVFRYDQLEDAIKAQHDGSVIKPIIVFD